MSVFFVGCILQYVQKVLTHFYVVPHYLKWVKPSWTCSSRFSRSWSYIVTFKLVKKRLNFHFPLFCCKNEEKKTDVTRQTYFCLNVFANILRQMFTFKEIFLQYLMHMWCLLNSNIRCMICYPYTIGSIAYTKPSQMVG